MATRGSTRSPAAAANRDIFDFNGVGESVEGANRDRILDFNRADERIDLSTIDARTNVGGNNAFIFIGNDGFSDRAGELRFTQGNGLVIVQGDTNGDGVANFEIRVNGGALAAN